MQIWNETEWLVRAPARPAEGPVWDIDRQSLWWVDIMEGHVHLWDRHSGEDTVYDVGEAVGALALRVDGSVLVALQTRLAFLDPDSGEVETFVPLEGNRPANRANDGKAGPDGAFWIGTMAVDASPEAGALYHVTGGGEVSRLLNDVSISNGLDWLDDNHLYYIDSLAHGVDVLEVDRDAWTVLSRSRVLDIDPDDGLPDGMTLDAEGCLWVAVHGGGQVRRYSQRGELLGWVEVPMSLVTCCAFGGPDLTELYVTVAADDGVAGGLLRCDVGIAGRPPYRFAG